MTKATTTTTNAAQAKGNNSKASKGKVKVKVKVNKGHLAVRNKKQLANKAAGKLAGQYAVPEQLKQFSKVDVMRPVNGSYNCLGHRVDKNVKNLGGKNVRCDALLIQVINNDGIISNEQIVDTLCGKVNNGRVFDGKAMKAKFAAHIKHLNGKGKVAFKPSINIDGKALYTLGDTIRVQVNSALMGI